VRALSLITLLAFTLLACGSKKDAPPAGGSAEPPKSSAEPPKGSAEPPKGSAEPPKGSAAEPPKTGSDTASGSGSGAATGSGSDAVAAGSGSGSGSGGETKKWFDNLSRDEKMDFMKKQVVPTMKPMFQKFDAKEFANFGCKTCHGKDPQKSKYKMPSSDIPALDFAAIKAGKQKPAMAKWMGEVVKPEMAKLLKESEYTEANPTGFGCLHCHELKK